MHQGCFFFFYNIGANLTCAGLVDIRILLDKDRVVGCHNIERDGPQFRTIQIFSIWTHTHKKERAGP